MFQQGVNVCMRQYLPGITWLPNDHMPRICRNLADKSLFRDIPEVFVRPYPVSDSEAVVKKKEKQGKEETGPWWIPPQWQQNVKYLWATAPKSVKIKGCLSFFGATGKWCLKESDSIDSVSHESPAPSPASVACLESPASVDSESTVQIKLGDTAATVHMKDKNHKEKSGMQDKGVKPIVDFPESDAYCFKPFK